MIDTSLRNEARAHGALAAADGAPRPVGVTRFDDGTITAFVENELVLTAATPAAADAFAARHKGRVLASFTPTYPGAAGARYLVRVSTEQAPPDAIGPQDGDVAFSSPEARNLLIIAKSERKAGADVGVNLLDQPSGLLEGVTSEGNNADALSLNYMQTGGVLDVDVKRAWRALALAGKAGAKTSEAPLTKNNNLIGILDSGFGYGTPAFKDADYDVAIAIDTGAANPTLCGASACPWHGNNVSEAAAGIADDLRGAAGPAGPVSRIVAYHRSGGSYELQQELELISNLKVNGVGAPRAFAPTEFFNGVLFKIGDVFPENKFSSGSLSYELELTVKSSTGQAPAKASVIISQAAFIK
jgi:hypothetical protein